MSNKKEKVGRGLFFYLKTSFTFHRAFFDAEVRKLRAVLLSFLENKEDNLERNVSQWS